VGVRYAAGLMILLLLLIGQTEATEVLVIPEELNEIAKENECSQVSDFFRRPGMVEPAHVYGYVPGPENRSAVFWCKKNKPSKQPYLLLFVFRDIQHELTLCPHKIEWEKYPGGLSLVWDRRFTLDEFVNLTNPKRRGPKGVRMKHRAVHSSYETGEYFYCHKGEWLLLKLD